MIFFAQDGDLVAATLLRLFELTAFISNVIYETDDETVGGTRDRRPVQAKTPPPPPPRKRESPARPWVVQETGALCKRRRLRRHRPERGKALQPHRRGKEPPVKAKAAPNEEYSYYSSEEAGAPEPQLAASPYMEPLCGTLRGTLNPRPLTPKP